MKIILSKELEKLRRKINYGFELEVVFKPKSNTDVYGEVKDSDSIENCEKIIKLRITY